MNELKPVFDLLSARFGWFSAVSVCIPALLFVWRMVIKPFNAKIQKTLTERLANAIETPEDAQWYHDEILTRGWYRFGSLLLDLFLSIKLPTHSDFNRLMNAQVPGTILPPEPPQTPINKPAGSGDLTR